MPSESKNSLDPLTEDEQDVETREAEPKKAKKKEKKKNSKSSKRTKSSDTSKGKNKDTKGDSEKPNDKAQKKDEISPQIIISMISSDLDSLSRHLASKFQTYGTTNNFEKEKHNFEYKKPQYPYQTQEAPRFFEKEIRESHYHHNSNSHQFSALNWRRKDDNVQNSIHRKSVQPQSFHYFEKRQNVGKPFSSTQNGQANFRNTMTQGRQNYFEEQEIDQRLQYINPPKQNYQINDHNGYYASEDPTYYQEYGFEGIEASGVNNFYDMGEGWKQPKKDIRELYKNKPKYMFIESEISSLGGSKNNSMIRPPQNYQTSQTNFPKLNSKILSAINIRKGV